MLCEDETQRAKVDEVRADVPRLEHVLTYADLDDLAARGRVHGRVGLSVEPFQRAAAHQYRTVVCKRSMVMTESHPDKTS